MRKRVFHSRRRRPLWKSHCCGSRLASSQSARTPPLRIAEPEIRCPRIELRAAGAVLQFRKLSNIARLFFAVQCGRLDSAGTPRLRIALLDIRCPRIELRAARCALLPKTNTQMSSESGLKRLYYKAFVEAKLPVPFLFCGRNHADRICGAGRYRLG